MQEYADSQKNQSGWAFTMIGDPLHLYEKAYGVFVPPFYFFTNHIGKILAMDKLAGVTISMDKLQSLIMDAAKNQPREQFSLPVIKEFTLSDSVGSPIVVGGTNFVVPFVHSSQMVVLDASFHYLYITDSVGRVHRKFE